MVAVMLKWVRLLAFAIWIACGGLFAAAEEGVPVDEIPPKGEAAEGSEIVVTVRDIRQEAGKLLVILVDDKADWKTFKPSFVRIVEPAISEARAVFEQIPPGVYAISVLHDINDNQDLDRKFMGIPKEPFGFSNNVNGAFGPPSFKRASFEVPGGGKRVFQKIDLIRL
jgi:uncharacterized protein (DUF2141 family)